jgi:hypothetical protein
MKYPSVREEEAWILDIVTYEPGARQRPLSKQLYTNRY